MYVIANVGETEGSS